MSTEKARAYYEQPDSPDQALRMDVVDLVLTGWLGAALTPAAKGAPAQVQVNRAVGNAFRDEMAGLLQQAGKDVQTEVYKKTPFGSRTIDIEVSQGGKVLGGVETKTGGSRYTPSQRAKDTWLKKAEGYPVTVVRDK
jgi:hypothetical protein